MGFQIDKVPIIGNKTKRIHIFQFCFNLSIQKIYKMLNAVKVPTHLMVS